MDQLKLNRDTWRRKREDGFEVGLCEIEGCESQDEVPIDTYPYGEPYGKVIKQNQGGAIESPRNAPRLCHNCEETWFLLVWLQQNGWLDRELTWVPTQGEKLELKPQ